VHCESRREEEGEESPRFGGIKQEKKKKKKEKGEGKEERHRREKE
jgi:hypothetical protein